MVRFLVRRVVQTAGVLWALATLVFLLVRMTGNPAAVLLPMDATPDDVARLTEALGLNRPWSVQYGTFLGNVLRGDFGESFRYRESVTQLVMERMPATVELALLAILAVAFFAIPLGILSAVKRNTIVDLVVRAVAILLQSMPSFWLGGMMIILLAVQLRWLPASGRGEWTQLIMPVVTLGLISAAALARILRSSILDVLSLDYVRTARAKGLSEKVVVGKHVLRNAAISFLTMLGLEFGRLISGTIVIEIVFSWPGVGRLIVQAVSNRDFPLVQGGVLILAVFVLLVNLCVDLLYTVVDPRIQYGRA